MSFTLALTVSALCLRSLCATHRTRYIYALDGLARHSKTKAPAFMARPATQRAQYARGAILLTRLASAVGVVPNSASVLALMRLAAASADADTAREALGLAGAYASHIRIGKDNAVEFVRAVMPRYFVHDHGGDHDFYKPSKRDVRAWCGLPVLASVRDESCARRWMRCLRCSPRTVKLAHSHHFGSCLKPAHGVMVIGWTRP